MIKYFFRKGIIFGALFFLILYFLNLYYLNILSNTQIQRTEDQLMEYKDEAKIIFLGDSHVQNAVNPEFIPGSFNFSSPGENYIQSFYKFKYFIENDIINPESIIIPIDLHSFASYQSERFINEWYWRNYIDFKEWAQISNSGWLQKEIIAFFPVIGNGGALLQNIKKKPKLTKIIKGGSLVDGDYSKIKEKEASAKKRVLWQFNNSKIFDESLLSYFGQFINFANQKGIKIYLIKYPVTKEYYNEAVRFVDVDDYYKKIDNIIVDKNVKILDFQKLFFSKPNYFYNIDHLNKDGADVLTERIKEDIKL